MSKYEKKLGTLMNKLYEENWIAAFAQASALKDIRVIKGYLFAKATGAVNYIPSISQLMDVYETDDMYACIFSIEDRFIHVSFHSKSSNIYIQYIFEDGWEVTHIDNQTLEEA